MGCFHVSSAEGKKKLRSVCVGGHKVLWFSNKSSLVPAESSFSLQNTYFWRLPCWAGPFKVNCKNKSVSRTSWRLLWLPLQRGRLPYGSSTFCILLSYDNGMLLYGKRETEDSRHQLISLGTFYDARFFFLREMSRTAEHERSTAGGVPIKRNKVYHFVTSIHMLTAVGWYRLY